MRDAFESEGEGVQQIRPDVDFLPAEQHQPDAARFDPQHGCLGGVCVFG